MPQLNFNALASEGPQGVYQGFMQGQQLQNKLAAEQQARQLSDIQLQNALREQRIAGEEEASWKAGAGNPQAVLQQLQQRGLGKQAMALQGLLTKQQADKLAQQKTQFELVKNAANQVFANPQNAAQILTSFGQRTGIDMSDDLAQLQQLGNNPEAVKQWAAGIALEADKMLPKFQQISAGGSTIVGTVNPLDARFKPVSELQHTMTPSEAANVGLRAQEVGLRGREVNLREEEARLKREGIEGISPKELQKRNAALPQAKSSVESFESKTDAFIKDLEKLRDDPGLNQITGPIYGRTPSASREGSRAQSTYNKIFAKGGFQGLQDLREASKTGGALGNVSNEEGRRLEASVVGGLDRTQHIDDVKAGINALIEDLKVSKARVRNTFDDTYSYKADRRGAGPAANAAGGVDTNNPLLK